jgi:hypothetical protein
MNSIIEALPSDKHNIRLSNGSKWMFWDTTYSQWVVMGRSHGAKTSKILLETEYADKAIEYLLKEE